MRPQPPRALGKDLERVVDINGNDRNLRGDRQAERRVLERQQLTGAAARPLGEDEDRRDPFANGLRRLVVRFERFLAGRSIDGDVTGGAHRPAEQRNLEQLLLGNHAHGAGERGEERPNVEHRRMVGGVHERLSPRNALETIGQDRSAGGLQDVARPVHVRPVVDPADAVFDAQNPADNGAGRVYDCGDDEDYVIPDGADTHAK